jgi:predicted methyltransferase
MDSALQPVTPAQVRAAHAAKLAAEAAADDNEYRTEILIFFGLRSTFTHFTSV